MENLKILLHHLCFWSFARGWGP